MKTFTCILGLVACLPAAVIHAQTRPADEHVRFGYAQVLSAVPAYETVRFVEPREECYDQPVVRRENDPNVGGALLGAVVGGVLGSQVGSGSGRRAATVAGAIAGGAVGNQAGNRPREYQDVERRCRLVDVQHEEERLLGYDVEYRYKDEIFYARMPNDPGNNLRVRVAVTPVN